MRLRRAAVAASAAALMIVPASAASAGVSSWESTVPPLIPYQNEEYALLGGVLFEQGCRGEFEEQLAHTVRPPGKQIRQARWTEPQYLFDLSEWGADDVWELIDIGCEAVFTGGEVPTPLASGEGTVRWIEQDSNESTGKVVGSGSVRGDLVDDSGQVYRVQGRYQDVFIPSEPGSEPNNGKQTLTVRQR